MSYGFDVSSFDPYADNWRQGGRPWLAEQFCNVSQFLRGFRVRMRYGELTRAPLHILRFNFNGEIVKCDWLARSPDTWDADVAPSTRARHASLQALKDAIDVRALLFEIMPEVQTADFRVYRENNDHRRELIITGCVQRHDHSSRSIHSLAMRAKILGFRFNFEGDELFGIPAEEQTPIGG